MTINKIVYSISTLFIIVVCLAVPKARGEEEPRRTCQEEKDFYVSEALPAMNKVKKAVPPAPAGWIIAGETKADRLPDCKSDDMGIPAFRYVITYKRIAGVKEEQKKLDEVYAESSRRNRDAAKPLIDELIKQQTRTSLALRKAARRKNREEEKRLNDELEENGRKMQLIHEDVERKISQDVEPFLVKDAEAGIQVEVNDEFAELPQGEAFPVKGAAFGLRKSGERTGTSAWKGDQLLILYGDWQQSGNNRFRGAVKRIPLNRKAQTIKITITGDKHAEQLLKQMDLKSILSLMH